MAGKKKAENFMKEIASEKEWNALCEYKVIFLRFNSEFLSVL